MGSSSLRWVSGILLLVAATTAIKPVRPDRTGHVLGGCRPRRFDQDLSSRHHRWRGNRRAGQYDDGCAALSAAALADSRVDCVRAERASQWRRARRRRRDSRHPGENERGRHQGRSRSGPRPRPHMPDGSLIRRSPVSSRSAPLSQRDPMLERAKRCPPRSIR